MAVQARLEQFYKQGGLLYDTNTTKNTVFINSFFSENCSVSIPETELLLFAPLFSRAGVNKETSEAVSKSHLG